jgi:glycerophosphoryl diester phosphodiesterase
MEKKSFQVIAHRGVSAEYAENTLPAFQAAIDMGCEGIELDVHISLEGAPVVVHDPEVKGKSVAQMTLAELADHDIPSLREVLDLERGDSTLMVELKEGDNPIDELVSNAFDLLKHDPGNWVIGSLSPEIMDHLRGASPRLVGIADSEHAIDQYLVWKLPLLAIDHTLATERCVDTILSSGAKCWVWTVDDSQQAQKLADLGVSGIITNNPRLLMP